MLDITQQAILVYECDNFLSNCLLHDFADVKSLRDRHLLCFPFYSRIQLTWQAIICKESLGENLESFRQGIFTLFEEDSWETVND